MTTRERELDVVVWGATGFTGQLVSEYLIDRYPDGALQLGLGGRDRQKLEAVRTRLAAAHPGAAELPLVVGDSFDAASLDALASRTRVVCTTVGPYAKYGAELVAACVRQGTDYCDLTGEVQFIRRMIDAHHDAAKQNGTRIVHCCGYDSIPSDLGTLLLQETSRERHGASCREVKLFAGESKGSMSGGTIASMLNVLDEARRDRDVRRVIADPYALNPEGERRGPDGPDPMRVRRDPDLGMWVGPFVMAAINSRVVRRSNALSGYAYGRDFRYSEEMSFGRGVRGLFRATAFTAGLGAFMAAANARVTRGLLEHKLPQPGEGPSREQREAGYFVTRLIGKATDPGMQMRVRVEGQHDPGYGETSRMLGESAACLALDRDQPGTPGGILTPASAMGLRLVERLRDAGMVFDVE